MSRNYQEFSKHDEKLRFLLAPGFCLSSRMEEAVREEKNGKLDEEVMKVARSTGKFLK